MSKNMLEIKNVTKKFGKTIAVNDVSLNIQDSEFFCFIGPSGCGKTTMLKTIIGLEKPDSGNIYIDGIDVVDIPTAKREIALVFQNFALFPHKSVFENIAFGLKMRNISMDQINDRVTESMKLVGLEDLKDRLPRELSGGQQQRVALARSIVIEPKVLLFDEPLGNLDFKLQKKMETELKLLHKRVGITSVYVTHNQEQSLILGDRVAVMNQGIFEQIGSPQEIYERPKTVFVAKFVGEINMLKGRVKSVTSNKTTVETELGDFTSNSTSDLNIGDDVAYAIRPEKISVHTDKKPFDNNLNCKNFNFIYKGSMIEYILDVSSDRQFKSIQSASSQINSDNVKIGWNNNNSLILKKPSLIKDLDIDRVLLGH
tara:strand:+ start:925 stop:2037 length:1113 start_codon:yes stop_codon:yes gene_type:complete